MLGIVLPLLPTTPFLLLAAACFLRSSPEFHGWLVGHPHLGKYIEYYLGGRGMPFRAKVYTLAMLWSTMALSAWLVSNRWVSLTLLITGLAVSVHMARLPTRQSSEES
ncbi:YbaN family protein [Allohahella marinimesophila]|uniref:YbaN family protein n=1 Tax=Allohahella marinimesophila TaxID=1054972 RepID=UPI003CD076B5